MRSSTLFLLSWSRQLAHESRDAANAFYQCFRRVHGLPAALPEVPPEAAGSAARRSVPLLRFPSSLEVELEAVLADHGVKPREARRLGLELAERLKSISHTPQRGGVGPESIKPAAARGRLRGADLLAAREAFEAGELLSMDDRAVNAALGLPPPLRDDERHAPQMHKLAPKYKSEAEVIGYVVARMAPEYAVCRRVMDEAVRLLEAAEAAASLPGGAGLGSARWRPREALVYGAGVGAAVVAALEGVASPSLKRIVALEPSPLRQILGSRIEKAHRARLLQQQEQELNEGQGVGAGLAWQPAGDRRARRQHAAAGPVVSWVQALPPLTKAAAAQRRRYDLVIAPYQLTVLPTLEERQRLVRELWDRCGDVLVLVEPGTPRGFAAIAEARELVLGREGRKRSQLEAAASEPSGGAHMSTGGGAGGAGPDPRVVGKLKGAGAHVVAPCPHDGTCPMLGRRRDWCHFSQPLLLPAFMQQAMALPADQASGRGRALNVQDERFSYVILRRGRRPDFRVAVSRDDNDAVGVGVSVGGAGGALRAAASAPAPLLPSRLPPRTVLSQVLLNRAAGEATPDPASAGAAAATALPADRAEGLLHVHTGTGAAAPAVAASQRTAARRAPLFSSHVPADVNKVTNSESPSAGTPGGPAAGAPAGGVAGFDGGGNGGAAVARRAAVPGPATAAFAHKYPAYGPGLVGRLIALQDAGVEWADLAEAEQPDDEGEPTEVAEAASGAGGGGGGAAAVAVRTAATTTVAAKDGRERGAGGGGGSSARIPGLDAAVAERSMSIFGQAPGLAVEGGPQQGEVALGVRDGAGADAWQEAQAGAAGGVWRPAAAGPGTRAAGTEAQDQPPAWTGAPLKVPTVWVAEAYGGLQLTGDDVSEAEYDLAERQLMERIYGAEAARAWLAARSAGPAAFLGEDDGDGDGGGWLKQADGLEELDNIAGGVRCGRGPRPVAAAEAPEVAGVAAQGGGWEAGGGEGEEERQQGDDGDLGAAQGAGVAARRLAEASSYGWGRLVRSPRLRGGHVILDMCVGPQHHYPDSAPVDAVETTTTAAVAAAEGQPRDAAEPRGWATGARAAADADNGGAAVAVAPEDPTTARPQGRLVQQVVARSARRGWMGAPAYRLARRLSLGDCWPDWYIRSHNTREAAAPPPASAGAGNGPDGADDPEPRLGSRKSAV